MLYFKSLNCVVPIELCMITRMFTCHKIKVNITERPRCKKKANKNSFAIFFHHSFYTQ